MTDRLPSSSASRAVLLDLLMATMNSVETWRDAAGGSELGLAWRDAVTRRMIAAGRYVPYDHLVAESAAELDLDHSAPSRLRSAWRTMRPWPDAAAVDALAVPHAFVTNCSTRLAAVAVERSGLRPAFVLSAQEAGWYKPRPEIYRLACRRLGLRPDEVRFVAGAAYDAAGARAAGLDAVLVLRRPSIEAPVGVVMVEGLREALCG